MKREKQKSNEHVREELPTIRDFLLQLFPPNIVDEVIENVEKKRKQEEGKKEE